jgi:hypothetical protein
VVARHLAIVLIERAVALAPLVELAARNTQPLDQRGYRQASFCGPVADEIDDFVAQIGLDPALL